jgi:hypothetical protein
MHILTKFQRFKIGLISNKIELKSPIINSNKKPIVIWISHNSLANY